MIKARIFYNQSCLKCGSTDNLMVRIGAFTMCIKCFKYEFNIDEIDPEGDSKDIKNYYRWLKFYKNAL